MTEKGESASGVPYFLYPDRPNSIDAVVPFMFIPSTDQVVLFIL